MHAHLFTSVSSTVGQSVDPGTTSRHFGAETKIAHVIRSIFKQKVRVHFVCQIWAHNSSHVYSILILWLLLH